MYEWLYLDHLKLWKIRRTKPSLEGYLLRPRKNISDKQTEIGFLYLSKAWNCENKIQEMQIINLNAICFGIFIIEHNLP